MLSAALLAHPATRLHELVLSGNTAMGDVGAAAWAQALACGRDHGDGQGPGEGVESGHFADFGVVMPDNRNLVNVAFDGCGLYGPGALALMAAILPLGRDETSMASRVEPLWLDLSENKLGTRPDFGEDLAAWLRDSTTRLRWKFLCALNTNGVKDTSAVHTQVSDVAQSLAFSLLKIWHSYFIL